jgi:hypothetical protein
MSLQVFYLWRYVSSTAPPFILWWPNLEILFDPLHRSSPFIGELRCQAIKMEHGSYIADRAQKAVYIVRCLWSVHMFPTYTCSNPNDEKKKFCLSGSEQFVSELDPDWPAERVICNVKVQYIKV